MTDTERWVDCLGYEGLYQVSDRGRVFNLLTKKFLKGTVTSSGYRQVQLTNSEKRLRCFLVHVLVLSAFVGPRPAGLVADHLSTKKLDNSLANLEWVTQKENVLRALRAGLFRPNPRRGSRHPRAKLTEAIVRTIREEHKNGVRIVELARRYGVSSCIICQVVKRSRWKHVV